VSARSVFICRKGQMTGICFMQTKYGTIGRAASCWYEKDLSSIICWLTIQAIPHLRTGYDTNGLSEVENTKWRGLYTFQQVYEDSNTLSFCCPNSGSCDSQHLPPRFEMYYETNFNYIFLKEWSEISLSKFWSYLPLAGSGMFVRLRVTVHA
jgi:hypothetical protein